MFPSQANHIGKRFIKKGYNPREIEEKIKELTSMNHSDLIKDNKKTRIHFGQRSHNFRFQHTV